MKDGGVIDRQFIFKGRKVALYLADITMPDGRAVRHEIVDHPGSVAMLALLDNANVVLEDHYRFVAGGNLLEIPAGTLEPGEDPLEAARRELVEETGYSAREMIPLGSFYTSPGVLSEVMNVYLARGLVRGEPDLEFDEVLEIVEIPFEQALDYALSGRIRDAKTIAALFMARYFLDREMQDRTAPPER